MPCPQNLWRLAKHVFRSLDSAYHQLVSHWLRWSEGAFMLPVRLLLGKAACRCPAGPSSATAQCRPPWLVSIDLLQPCVPGAV